MRALFFVLLILTATFWVWSLRRANTLFTLRVREGRIASTKGRIPPRLLAEIADIVDRAGVTHANIRGVPRNGLPVLLFEGELSPGIQQQMRNVVGQFTTTEIKSGKRH